MALQNIFIDIELHSEVSIKPSQLKNDLYIYIKQNLQHKLEGRCLNNMFICKIKNIVKYRDGGYILPEDFSGNVIFKVTYIATVCKPIVNTQIIAKCSQFAKSIVLVENGPINAVINFADVNSNLFKISNTGSIIYKKSNKVIEVGDHLKITIRGVRGYNSDTSIGVMAFLDEIATDNEIYKFMYKEIDDEYEIETNEPKNISFNEDELVDNEPNVLITNNTDQTVSLGKMSTIKANNTMEGKRIINDSYVI